MGAFSLRAVVVGVTLIACALAGCGDAPVEVLRTGRGDGALPDAEIDDGSIADTGPDALLPPAENDRLAVGLHHTCALRTGGTVWCWGRNDRWQLGREDGSGYFGWGPVEVEGIAGAVDLAAGAGHTCALLGDGTVRCWGGRPNPGVGTGSPTPERVDVHDAVALTAGWSFFWPEDADATGLDDPIPMGHTCALIADGTVRCWGANAVGQLGDGTTRHRFEPVRVEGLSNAVALSASRSYGYDVSDEEVVARAEPCEVSLPEDESYAGTCFGGHTCALLETGEARCWGDNSRGQLGDGTNEARRTPATVMAVEGARAIAAGGKHSCAVLERGDVRCWGDNAWGQIGDGSRETRAHPVTAGLPGGAASVTAGSSHTCARLTDGRLFCWGSNGAGQLAEATQDVHTAPIEIEELPDVHSVHAGAGYTCVERQEGDVACVGRDTSRLSVVLAGVRDATAVTVGRDLVCVLREDGTVHCGEPGSRTGPQRPVDGLSDVVALDGKGNRACAVLEAGTVRCWSASATRPAPVEGLSGVASVSVNSTHACAVDGEGTAHCWGDNEHGQLGDGTTDGRARAAPLEGLSDVAVISAGYRHTCAVRDDGSSYCWGRNDSGQLGDGGTSNRRSPVRVDGISTAVDVSAGRHTTCAVLAGGAVRCWGDAEAETPVASGAVAVDCGLYHACALLGDGAVSCWGGVTKTDSRTGTGIFRERERSSPVLRVSGAVSLTAGVNYSCATSATGRVWCWGYPRWSSAVPFAISGLPAP